MPGNAVIPLSDYLPDQPAFGQKGLLDAKNVLPTSTGFREMRGIAAASDALPTKVLGALWAEDDDNNLYFFVGTNAGIYQLVGAVFQDISKVGGYNADRWEFISWGNRVIAINEVDPPQYFDLGVSTLFADLASDRVSGVPKARHIGVVRDFVVLGNLVVDGDDKRSRIWWSGFNNSEIWEPNRVTQAGFQDILGEGGRVQKIVPGEVGLVFLERTILLMSYTGPLPIFRFDEIESGRGTPAAQSVCWTGNTVFYMGHDGFYSTTRDGAGSNSLGSGRIDRTILEDVNTQFYDQVIGEVDHKRRLVFWAYPSQASAGDLDKLAIYSWEYNKWSRADLALDHISEYISPSLNLDQLDTVLADIDSESINVESDAYKGGLRGLVFFGTDHIMGTLDGAPLTAEFETGDFGGTEITLLSRVRPDIDGAGSLRLQCGARDRQDSNTVFGVSKLPNRIGEFSFRSRGRYHRLKLTIEGGFKDAVALEPYLAPAGDR